jgi:hypothetical protein
MSRSKFEPKGHLEIWKIYEDGEKELHWSEQNVITSGMGVGLSNLFSASGSSSIKDYQITYFQVGTGGDLTGYDQTQYKLNTHIPNSYDYGRLVQPDKDEDYTVAFADVEDLKPLENGSIIVGSKPFAKIRYSNVHRVAKNAVRYTLVLSPRSCNVTAPLNEVGLFMRNPLGADPVAPILVAYRPFTDIKKTDAFTLVFLWTIQF